MTRQPNNTYHRADRYVVVARLVPHPANFAPLTAMVIFAGAKATAPPDMILTLAAAIISDMLIGFYTFAGHACRPGLAMVWLRLSATVP